MQEQHQPQPVHQLPPPVFNDQPQPSAHTKSPKSLAIALIVSTVFLLAAAAIGVWLLTKPAGTSTVTQQPTGDGSDTVKKVGFVAPADLPAAYAPRQQNTQTTATIYYFDPATACGITTTVMPLTAELSKPKDAAVKVAETAHAYGVKTTNAADSTSVKIKDADGSHEYNFSGVLLDQSVAIQGVAFTAQRNNIAYKQFGPSVASIAYACKNESWEAKKPELEALVQAFKVKTER